MPETGTATSRKGESQPTRRGVLLGAVGLAGLGGTLAGCSTAAVPYDADEAGVPPQGAAAPSAMAMGPPAAACGLPGGPAMPSSAAPKKAPRAKRWCSARRGQSRWAAA